MNAEIIKEIHSKPVKIVLAVAGGGSEVIGELLRHGKGSNTILEATIPYCPKSFEEYIGGKPDKFVSEDAAASLATSAYERANKLDNSEIKKIGVGVTVSLAKDQERVGREHRAFFAIHTKEYTKTYYLELHATRTREEEETLISEFALNVLAKECEVASDLKIELPDTVIENKYETKIKIDDLFFSNPINAEKRIIMPGSFNPITSGHLHMAETVYKMFKKPVDLEICLKNIDKPIISNKAIQSRLNDFESHRKMTQSLGMLWFTQLPLFVDKAKIFKHSTFVIGFDTLQRLVDRKYYTSSETFKETFEYFRKQNIMWVVFPRLKSNGELSSQEEMEELIKLGDLSAIKITQDVYDALGIANISSSQIRKNAT